MSKILNFTDNKNMKIFFIVLLVLFCVCLPIKLRAKINYNILKNEGIVSVYLYKLKLLIAFLKFTKFKLELKFKKKKILVYLGKSNDISVTFSDIFVGKLIEKMKINDVRTFSKFGLCGDCLVSSIGCGSIIVISQIINSLLMEHKCGNFLAFTEVFPDYIENSFLFSFTISIKISLLLILKCMIISLFIKMDKGEVKSKD